MTRYKNMNFANNVHSQQHLNNNKCKTYDINTVQVTNFGVCSQENRLATNTK